jgi:4-amino-4-deoxy-L-arabinose transferase-like glycosyltransferase
MLLVGLIARDLGGSPRAQVVAAFAAAIAPISLVWSSCFSYSGFDYLWWVLIAFLVVRLLKTEDPRYWLGIGSALGLGMLTKYTIAFYVAGIAAGILLTGARRYLSSPWLWAGIGLAMLIFSPNLIWQVQYDYIYLHFLSFMHSRDIQIGRMQSFLVEQLYLAANPVAIPLWLAGLYYYFGTSTGRRYRMLGWMAAVPFASLLFVRGRGYYTSPNFPFLISAGAVYGEGWLASLPHGRARTV